MPAVVQMAADLESDWLQGSLHHRQQSPLPPRSTWLPQIGVTVPAGLGTVAEATPGAAAGR